MMLDSASAIEGLAAGAGVMYNASKSLSCFDIMTEFIECADPTGCGLGNNAMAADYQARKLVICCVFTLNICSTVCRNKRDVKISLCIII